MKADPNRHGAWLGRLPRGLALPRRAWIALILLTALAVGWSSRQKLDQTGQALADASAHLAALGQWMDDTVSTLNDTREKLRTQSTLRDEVLTAVARAEQALAKVEPDMPWATPPADWPRWETASPYVWVRKEMLPRLRVQVFADDGALRPDAAAALGVDEDQRASLNRAITNLVGEYRAIEFAGAERIEVDDHSALDGDRSVIVRIPPLPEAGMGLRMGLETALERELGSQRADLLLRTAEGWLDSQFNRFGEAPRLISVRRFPNGIYHLRTETAEGATASSGMIRIVDYLPAHLLPLFHEVIEPVE